MLGKADVIDGAGADTVRHKEYMEAMGAETLQDYWRVPTVYVNVLSQIRADRNPRQSKLDRSFSAEGQLQPALATIVSPEDMVEYIDFVNNTWGSAHTLEEMTPMSESGHYLLLMAGHSRLLSAEVNNMDLDVRVMAVDSVEDIITRQAHENIHSEPPIHRTARSIAELYLWNKRKAESVGQRYSQKNFVDELGYSRVVVDKALAYIQLPEEIRALVDNESLHFTVAAEIGIAQRKLLKAYPKIYYDEVDITELDAEQQADIHELTNRKLQSFAATYLKSTRVVATNAHIRAVVKTTMKHAFPDEGVGSTLALRLEDSGRIKTDIEMAGRELEMSIAEFEAIRARRAAELARNVSETAEKHIDAKGAPERAIGLAAIVEASDNIVEDATEVGRNTLKYMFETDN